MTRVVTELQPHEWGAVVKKRLNDEFFFFIALDEEVAVHRADIFEALWRRLGSVDVVDDRSAIPTDIACAGNAAIAAYLYSVHEASETHIAETLDVSPNTVEQYFADIKSGRRL